MKTLITSLCVVLAFLFATNIAEAEGEKLRIGTEGVYPPFNYIDENGELVGFDIDIGEALCEQMKADCEFVQRDWDSLIPGLVAGDYDIIIASMSITEEREKAVSFTIPYYSNMLSFIGNRSSGIVITDEGLKGKSVGSLLNTISSDYLEEHYNGIVEIKLYDTQDAALEDLVSGNLDLVLGDNLPSFNWLQTDAGNNCEFIGEFIDINDRIGMAVRQEDDTLREELNSALLAILGDGTYQQINDKYFPFSIYF